MRWMPALQIGSHRYFLPRSDAVDAALARAMLATTIGDPSPVSEIRHAIEDDPPLLIFAAYHFSIRNHDHVDVVASHTLAEHLHAHSTELWSAADAQMGVPESSDALRSRVQQLRNAFADLPHRQWLAQHEPWLQLSGPTPIFGGPRLPRTIRFEFDAAHRDPGQAPPTIDMLPVLARKIRDLQTLESAFDEQLNDQKLASLGELAYGLSHELNNPLANISMRAEALLQHADDNLTDNQKSSLQQIVGQSYRGFGMIADLMFYARPPHPEPGDCELTNLVASVAEEFRIAEHAGITIEFNPAAAIHTHVDALMIGEAIRAVIRNAVEAISPTGKICITTSQAEDQVQIRVEDSGPGISPAARRHALDPYYSGREAGRGLGLGLCRVHRIMELHGGRIELSGGLVGCVATLSFPPSAATAPAAKIGRELRR